MSNIKCKMDLNPFVNLIKDKCGLFFKGDRQSSLISGIRTRMSAKRLESHAEYFNNLICDENEFTHLINLLTINETYFFREPQHFRIISERLIPEIFKKRGPGEKARILSAGCSTGEEPYSAVIALMDKYGRGSQLISSITAVDIDDEAISAAKRGIFGRNSFRKIDDGIKKRYFNKIEDNRYEIADFVKENVEFKNFNLLSNLYPNTLQGMDIIFYRNVSIYFDPESQRKIFHKLSQILNESGYLFVSSSETLFHNIGILSLINISGVFLYHKGIEVRIEERRKRTLEIGRHRDDTCSHADLSPRVSVGEHGNEKKVTHARDVRPLPKAVRSDFKEKREDSHSLFDEALHLAKDKKYKEALSRLDKLLEYNPLFIKAYALKASALINLREIEEARENCLKMIEIERWNVEGYLLLGLIAKIEDNGEEIIKRFKEALYIQPSCWLAHFYLAEVYNSRGEMEHAWREYGIVIKLLKTGKLSDHGLTLFPLSFPAEQVVSLCQHNLKKLKIDD
jgi:chemotaxis protein methyltransferase CheR